MSTDTNANSWLASSPGDAFAQAGRKDEAAIWFRRALAADPGDVEAACGLVGLLLERRSLAEAIGVLEDCLRRKPFNVRLLAEQRRIGLALYRENLWREAEPWLRKALELESWDENLNNVYSRVRERADPRDITDDEITQE
jgi:tetratricopeptide (TPR) repeat protein